MAKGRASVSDVHPEPPPVTLAAVTRTEAKLRVLHGVQAETLRRKRCEAVFGHVGGRCGSDPLKVLYVPGSFSGIFFHWEDYE